MKYGRRQILLIPALLLCFILAQCQTQKKPAASKPKQPDTLAGCIVSGNFARFVELADKGADIHGKRELKAGQRAPIHVASEMGYTSFVKYLLDKGVDPNSVCRRDNSYNETPLYLAVDKNHIEVIQLLLERGADVNQDPYPIMTAAVLGQVKTVQLLLKYKPRLNIRTRDGYTALSLAEGYEYRAKKRLKRDLKMDPVLPQFIKEDREIIENYRQIIHMLKKAGARMGKRFREKGH